MFKCMRTKERGPDVPRPKASETRNESVGAVVFIPGHNSSKGGKARGMVTYNDIIENDFNHALARNIITKFSDVYKDWDVHVEMYQRFEDSYKAYLKNIKDHIYNISYLLDLPLSKILVIELHLNAAGVPEANGAEALVLNHPSAIRAKEIVDMYAKRFDVNQRGYYTFEQNEKEVTYRGVKKLKPNDRGAGFLGVMDDLGTPAIVWEPFFGDYKTKESEMFLSDFDSGIRKMTGFWFDYLKQLI